MTAAEETKEIETERAVLKDDMLKEAQMTNNSIKLGTRTFRLFDQDIPTGAEITISLKNKMGGIESFKLISVNEVPQENPDKSEAVTE